MVDFDNITLEIPNSLLVRLDTIAQYTNMSLNGLVNKLLADAADCVLGHPGSHAERLSVVVLDLEMAKRRLEAKDAREGQRRARKICRKGKK